MNTLESLIWWTEEYRKEVAKRQLAEEELKVEKDEVISDVIRSLYDPAPYRFDVVPVELLGSI